MNRFDKKDRVHRLRSRLSRIFDPRHKWLRSATNVVHVGANVGQEAALYAEHDVGVLWIEPIPAVFKKLTENIAPYPKQRAHNALLADKAGKSFKLNIATNNGASSSIFEISEHKLIWPEVAYEGSIDLVSQVLDDVLETDSLNYDALVMDTQGSELLVLKGAPTSIQNFRWVKLEAANFESYQGCATVGDFTSFLEPRGFRLVRSDIFARKPDNSGAYFDLLFERRLPAVQPTKNTTKSPDALRVYEWTSNTLNHGGPGG